MKLVANIMCMNELERLPRLMESLDFLDEIYIVDGGSTDGTIEYLSSMPKVKLFRNEWPHDHAIQRNFILDKTPDDSWIFYIDCDELPTIPLRQEMRNITESDEITNVVENCKDEQVPAIWMRGINLVKDEAHYDKNSLYELSRIFYKKDSSLRWKAEDHIHSTLNKQLFGISLGPQFSIVHFAALVSEDKLVDKRKIYTELGGETAAKEYYLLWPEKWITEELPYYIKF